MNKLPELKREAIERFFEALEILREEQILISNKDITCQIGEWLIECLYDGKRADSAAQKGWDVRVGERHIQVKSHAKAAHNKNRWSSVNGETLERVDELIIVIFTHDYKLKEFYKVPWEIALDRIRWRGKKKKRMELTWKKVKEYKQELDDLPRQDVLELFR